MAMDRRRRRGGGAAPDSTAVMHSTLPVVHNSHQIDILNLNFVKVITLYAAVSV
eukprot:SAG31_NODE_1986_length_6725_cov_3.779505_4_plen_54_part_00